MPDRGLSSFPHEIFYFHIFCSWHITWLAISLYVNYFFHAFQFLSMKLSAVNPVLDFNLESLLAKDVRYFGNQLIFLWSFEAVCFHMMFISFFMQPLQVSASTCPQNMSMLYPPLSHLSQTGFMQPNLSSMSLLNGGLKRQVHVFGCAWYTSTINISLQNHFFLLHSSDLVYEFLTGNTWVRKWSPQCCPHEPWNWHCTW